MSGSIMVACHIRGRNDDLGFGRNTHHYFPVEREKGEK